MVTPFPLCSNVRKEGRAPQISQMAPSGLLPARRGERVRCWFFLPRCLGRWNSSAVSSFGANGPIVPRSKKGGPPPPPPPPPFRPDHERGHHGAQAAAEEYSQRKGLASCSMRLFSGGPRGAALGKLAIVRPG